MKIWVAFSSCYETDSEMSLRALPSRSLPLGSATEKAGVASWTELPPATGGPRCPPRQAHVVSFHVGFSLYHLPCHLHQPDFGFDLRWLSVAVCWLSITWCPFSVSLGERPASLHGSSKGLPPALRLPRRDRLARLLGRRTHARLGKKRNRGAGTRDRPRRGCLEWTYAHRLLPGNVCHGWPAQFSSELITCDQIRPFSTRFLIPLFQQY